MSARTQVYCRSHLRRGDCRDAHIDFRYCKMGRINRWPKNYRSNGAKTHEVGAAGNPFRQIREGIHSGNEYRPSAVRELAARSSKTSDRKGRRTAPWTDGLESKNKKHLAALPRRAAHPFWRTRCCRNLLYWVVACPMIIIGLAVVGI